MRLAEKSDWKGLIKSEFAVGASKLFTMTFVSLTGYMNAGPFKFIYFTDYLNNSLLSPKLLIYVLACHIFVFR
jgi:hypothetical protein